MELKDSVSLAALILILTSISNRLQGTTRPTHNSPPATCRCSSLGHHHSNLRSQQKCCLRRRSNGRSNRCLDRWYHRRIHAPKYNIHCRQYNEGSHLRAQPGECRCCCDKRRFGSEYDNKSHPRARRSNGSTTESWTRSCGSTGAVSASAAAAGCYT